MKKEIKQVKVKTINTIANKAGTGAMIMACVLALVGCGATQNKSLGPTKTIDTQIDNVQNELSAFQKIKNTYAVNQVLSPQQIIARNTDLLNLANDFVNQGDCRSSDIIIQHIEGTITNTSAKNLALAKLLKAECQIVTLSESTNTFYDAKNTDLLARVDSWMAQINENTFDASLRARYGLAKAKLAALKGDYAEALMVLASRPLSFDSLDPSQASNILWRWYSLLANNDKARLRARFAKLNDYASLFDMVQDSSVNDSIRQTSIKSWLLQNPDSAIANNLPTPLQSYLAIESVQEQKIAVLLPLSGRLAGQGEAIKQGLLAAYLARVNRSADNQNQPSTEIEFIDTGSDNTLPGSIGAESLAAYEIIIGPLLKSHIQQIQSFALPNLKQVVLNQPQEQTIGSDDTLKQQSISAYFSLSPEQEAQQLVVLMRAQDIQQPVLIKDNSSIGNRMAAAFKQAWIDSAPQNTRSRASVAQASQAPSVVQEISYTNNQSMRVGITSALDVLQSQRRIQQLSNLDQERVYSVTRNRRDVDAFVVFSQPDELELINPIIESSISLFTDEQLPVFASSYGYDHKQSKNSQRDLRNLVFIDMPWLLSNDRQDTLSKQVDKLFNQPSSTFLRLFAFGYDALAIADNIVQLSTFDYMKIQGLSGTLSFAEDNSLNRELAWLAITENNSAAN